MFVLISLIFESTMIFKTYSSTFLPTSGRQLISKSLQQDIIQKFLEVYTEKWTPMWPLSLEFHRLSILAHLKLR